MHVNCDHKKINNIKCVGSSVHFLKLCVYFLKKNTALYSKLKENNKKYLLIIVYILPV